MNHTSFGKKGIILVPYAEIEGYRSGVNISQGNSRRDIYLKNCCVACLSAMNNNDEATDVALVTNIDVPEKYRSLLESSNVKILTEEFDLFKFPGDYSWALAFYKLCALYKIARKYDYHHYAYLDSDVYIQNSFNNIWAESEDYIMLYDINHGLQVAHYRHFLDEVKSYTKTDNCIVHYGGELFASNKNNALLFSETCLEIFNDMLKKQIKTTHGDEFIVSIAASQLKNRIKNAGAYIYRFWTGEFRLVSTCYANNEVTVLHVPDEKEAGMVRLFHEYQNGNKFVEKNKVYSLLHLKRRSFKITLVMITNKLLGR